MSPITHPGVNPTLVAHVAAAMQRILTEVANEAALSSGWLRRQRCFTGASFVQTWVFASLDQPSVTTEALARMSGTVGRRLVDQA